MKAKKQQQGPKVVAITNQKGGVGKTTSAVTLATERAKMGVRTLLVDFDQQANATQFLGLSVPRGQHSDVFQLFSEDSKGTIANLAKETQWQNLYVLRAATDLVDTEEHLRGRPMGVYAFHECVKALEPGLFDLILVDCAPSLGSLMANATVAAHKVIVPVQYRSMSIAGLSKLSETIASIEQHAPRGRLAGIFGVEVDMRNAHAHAMRDVIQKQFKKHFISDHVRVCVKLPEAFDHQRPVQFYAPSCKAAKDYRKLTEVLVARGAL